MFMLYIRYITIFSAMNLLYLNYRRLLIFATIIIAIIFTLFYSAWTAHVPRQAISKEVRIMTVTLSPLVVSGTRASYDVGVDATGAATIDPVSGGSPVTGSSVGVIQFSDVSMFVLNSSEEQEALLYEAALGREPDVAGLETWIGIYNSLPASVKAAGVYASLAETAGGFNGSMSIADGFVNSAEFQAKYGALTDQEYVTQLYANVLHRAPDQSGLTTWMTALTPVGQSYVDSSGVSHAGQGESRAYVLVGFAESQENIADCAASSTTSATAGWLINTDQGGYADAGAQLSPSTVLSQAGTTHYVDTSLINTSTLTRTVGVVVGDLGLNSTGVSINNNASGYTVVASGGLTTMISSGANNNLITDANGGSWIELGGTTSSPGNDTAILHGSNNDVHVFALGNTITGYSLNGTDTLYVGNLGGPNPTVITNATASNPYNGANVTTTIYNSAKLGNVGFSETFIYVGSLSDTSATTMANAANAVYRVADTNLETVVFFGGHGSDTVMYAWALPTANASFTTADANGNHLVDASELTSGVTLVGVAATSITAASLADHSL